MANNELTARKFFTWLAGSYIIAAILNLGLGLIINAPWRSIAGGMLIMGLLLFGLTLTSTKKQQGDKDGLKQKD